MGREEGIQTGIAIGEQRGMLTGVEKANLDNARSFLADGLSIEQVVRCINLPLETVCKLKAEVSATKENL